MTPCEESPTPRPRIEVIHVFNAGYECLAYPSLPEDEVEERRIELRQDASVKIQGLLTRALAEGLISAADAPWKVHVRHGSPRMVVTKAVKQGDADLLALGNRQFITILYQIDEGMRRILGIAQGKSKESMQELIEELGEHVASIRFVCSDMSQAYRSVIAAMLGESVHILDRFHIVQNLNKAIDQVRNQEANELARTGSNPLKGSKYCFLKKPKNLTGEQKLRLKDLIALGLKTVRAYQLKEMFQALWAYESPAWARKFLRAWCDRAGRSRLAPVQRFARTLRQNEDLILNWFEAKKQFSSGVVEGMNRKINLITRKSYGFRSADLRKTALFHTLGQLPEPEFTHQFC